MAPVGEAWLSLTRELEHELRLTDPEAVVIPSVGASGLLQLKVRSTVIDRRTVRSLTREWERRAAATCETCGGSVSAVREAPMMVTVVCAHCADSPRG
jgi:hypothetical protein